MNISAVQNIKLEAVKNSELKRNNNIFAEPTEPQKDSVSFKADAEIFHPMRALASRQRALQHC